MIQTCPVPPKNGRPLHASTGSMSRPRAAVEVAAATGPLRVLAGHDVLVIADCQNLDMGARNLGFAVDWKRLGRRMAWAARSTARHAFIAEPAGSTRQAEYLARSGWTPHSKVSRTVRSWRGVVSNKNTDHLIAFFAGVLASGSHATLVLVASGDGDLVEDLSEALGMLPPPRPIATLSLAGSTSRRLDARHSCFVIENIELGIDCLKPGREHGRRANGYGQIAVAHGSGNGFSITAARAPRTGASRHGLTASERTER